MSLVTLAVLTLAAFLTSIISAVVGMAGGVVLLSIMTVFLDLAVVVPVHGLVQLASNGTRGLSLWPHVEQRIIVPTLIGMPIGVFIAVRIIQAVDNREIFLLLIAALIFYVLFKPKRLPPLKIPFWSFGLLAIVVGILTPLVGATGPLMAPFYLRDDLSKETIVATKATAQAYGHLLKLPAFLYLGFDYGAWAVLIGAMILGVVVGTRYGVTLLARISERHFRFVFRAALFLAACRLVYKGVGAML